MTKTERVGQTETITRVARWHECDECSNPASHRVTFLLENARYNPRSSAYGRDDCSRCSDLDAYACRKHLEQTVREAPSGYSWCAHMALKSHKHMGFYWHTIS